MAGANHWLLTLTALCALCATVAPAADHPTDRPPDTRPKAAASETQSKPALKSSFAPPSAHVMLACPASAATVQAAQAAAAASAGVAVQTVNSIGMKLVLVPAGRFTMGSPQTEPGRAANDEMQHPVQIPSAFYIGEIEVTEGQYAAVMGSAPPGGQGASYPVVRVSWHDAMEFCRRLSAREGRTYRLPTEAEWEYACRAGRATRFPWGDSSSEAVKYANVPISTAVAKGAAPKSRATAGDTRTGLVPAGEFAPNALGLRDMIGNVWDWCQSLKKDYPYNAADGRENLDAAGERVLRGGSWSSYADCCRSAARYSFDPGSKYNHISFRVVASVQQPQQSAKP